MGWRDHVWALCLVTAWPAAAQAQAAPDAPAQAPPASEAPSATPAAPAKAAQAPAKPKPADAAEAPAKAKPADAAEAPAKPRPADAAGPPAKPKAADATAAQPAAARATPATAPGQATAPTQATTAQTADTPPGSAAAAAPPAPSPFPDSPPGPGEAADEGMPEPPPEAGLGEPPQVGEDDDGDDEGGDEGGDDESDDDYPWVEVGGRLIAGIEHHVTDPDESQLGPDTVENRQPFFLQQARLKLQARLSDSVRATLSGDLEARPMVRNAYLNVKLKRWLQLRAGRFKRPFSRIESRSIGKLAIRDRGIFNRLLIEGVGWGDRALGAMLWGRIKKPKLKWQLAVTNSSENIGLSRAEQRRGVDVIGRLSYAPAKWIDVGVNGGHKVQEPLIGGENLGLNAIGGDVRLRGGGLYAIVEANLAEYPECTGCDPFARPTDPDQELRTPTAATVMTVISYDSPLNDDLTLQPTLAIEWVDTDTDFAQSETARFVVGMNLLWGEHLRVMPQVEAVRPLGEVTALSQVESERYYVLISAEL